MTSLQSGHLAARSARGLDSGTVDASSPILRTVAATVGLAALVSLGGCSHGVSEEGQESVPGAGTSTLEAAVGPGFTFRGLQAVKAGEPVTVPLPNLCVENGVAYLTEVELRRASPALVVSGFAVASERDVAGNYGRKPLEAYPQWERREPDGRVDTECGPGAGVQAWVELTLLEDGTGDSTGFRLIYSPRDGGAAVSTEWFTHGYGLSTEDSPVWLEGTPYESAP